MNWKKNILGLALGAYLVGCGDDTRTLPPLPTRNSSRNEEVEQQKITTDYCRTPIVGDNCENVLPDPNYKLSQFPQPFITSDGRPNGMIVVCSFATPFEVESAKALSKQLGYDQSIGCEDDFICDTNGQTIYQFESVGAPNARNLILIGTPCENRLIKETLQTENCECKFDQGTVFGHTWRSGATTLYVTGPTGQEVYEASSLLTESRFKPLRDVSNSIRTTDVCYNNLD